MNSREIELVLQARLEAADAAADASAVGNQMSQAIEQAFVGVGERIASRLVGDIQQALRGIDFLGLGGRGGAPEGLSLPGGMQQPLIGASAKTGPITSHSNQARINQKYAGSGYDMYGVYDSGHIQQSYHGAGGGSAHTPSRPNVHLGLTSMMTSALEGIPGLDLNKYGMIAGEQVRDLDQKINAYQRFTEVKRRNPNAKMSDFGLKEEDVGDIREKATSAMTAGSIMITNLERQLNDLTTTLTANTKALEEAKNTNKELRTTEQQQLVAQEELKNSIEQVIPNLKGVTGSMGRTIDDLPTAQGPWWRNQSNMMLGAKGLAMAGQGLSFAGDMPYMQMRGAAGAAQIAGFTTRDVMSGDYEGLMATQLAGGADAMKGRARMSTTLGIAGNLVGGVASIVGGAMTSKMGGFMGIPIGASMAMSGARDIMQYEAAVAARMQENKSLAGQENAELIGMYSKARSNVQMGYQDAIGLGSDRYSDFLAGEGAGGGVLAMSARSGLTRAQIMQNQRSFVQQMGGALNGGNSLSVLSSEITDLNFAQGEGFRSASNVAGGMYRGGEFTGSIINDQRAALTGAREHYYGLRGMVEEGSANELLENAANRSNQAMGLGANAFAGARFAGAQANARGMEYGPGASVIQRMFTSMIDSTNTGAGPEGIAKFRALQELEKRLGRKLTPAERITMQGKEFGTKYLKDHFGKELANKGFNAEDELGRFNQTVRKENVDIYASSIMGGDRDAAKSLIAIKNGAGSGEEVDIMAGSMEAAVPSLSDITKPQTGKPRDKASGRKETEQETINEIEALTQGMKTLLVGFNKLETGAKDAATRLKEIADTTVREGEKNPNQTKHPMAAGGRVAFNHDPSKPTTGQGRAQPHKPTGMSEK